MSVAAVKPAGVFSGNSHGGPPDLFLSYERCHGQGDSSWCWVKPIGALMVVAALVSDAFVPIEQPVSWNRERWCSQSGSCSKSCSGSGSVPQVGVLVAQLWTWGLEYEHSQSNSGRAGPGQLASLQYDDLCT